MSKWTPPEPSMTWYSKQLKEGTAEWYTTDQLLAVRQETIEECAALCKDDGERNDSHDRIWGDAVSSCADAILKLLEN